MRRLIVTANFVPSSPIHVTLMMEAQRSSETSVPTKATRRNWILLLKLANILDLPPRRSK
jgi:hypothetical protein